MKRTTVLPALAALLFGLTLPACYGMGRRSSVHGFESGPSPKPTVETFASMAHILASQGKDGEVEVVLLELIKRHPEYMPAYNELCEVYMRNDRIDRALKILDRGLEQDPDDAVLCNNLGMCLLLRADYGAAADAFQRAVEARPADARFTGNLASAQGMAGNFDDSLASYLEIVPPSDAHHNVAVLAQAFGDEGRATAEFATAERLAQAAQLDRRTRR